MKTYRINGKEIKQAGAWGDNKNFGHNDVNDVVNQLLEALDEKKEHLFEENGINTEKCKVCNRWKYKYEDGGYCILDEKKKEPKSTLKKIKVGKKTFNNMPNYKIHLPNYACGNHTKSTPRIKDTIENILLNYRQDIGTLEEQTDKIISLFKDTLLKKIENEIIVFGGCSSCDKCECQMKYKDAIKDTKQEVTNLIKNL